MTKTISSRERLSSNQKKSEDVISSVHLSDEVKNDTSKGVAKSTKQPTQPGLQIIHATTGRVRIRATDGSHNSILDTLSERLQQHKGVKDVFINKQTGSLTVNFDEKRVSLAQMLERLQEFGVQQLQSASQSESKVDPFAAWKSLDFWKDNGIALIPLVTGLVVTSRLGITGLASFPVYWITANATRRVIDYLEPQLSTTEKSINSQKTNNNTTDKSTSKSEVKQTSTNLAADSAKIEYSIVHAISGRIRFNVPRINRDRAYARRLERLLKTDPHVTNVRLNCDAASIAIAYGSGEIPVSHWVDLMRLADQIVPPTNSVTTTKEQPSPEPVTQLAQPTESITKTQQAYLETAGMWSDYKTPALSTALSFMANFPLDMVPY
jgi:copper chaperone CopZ